MRELCEIGYELEQKTDTNKIYVLIINGREHNVYIESIGQYYLFGRVALNKVAVLIDRPGRGGATIKVVLPQDEKNAVGPGDDLIHSVPCVVPSCKFRIRIKLEDVSVIEDPWRPMLLDEVFNQDGSINEEKLCEALPEFKQYWVEGKGFVASPEVWTPTLKLMKPTKTIQLADEDSSEDE
jgi:hypothetical protein